MSAIMKTMICPPSFRPDGFVATHAHGQTIHRVPKWTSCHKVIVVIPVGPTVFMNAYIMPILFLRDLSTFYLLWITIYKNNTQKNICTKKHIFNKLDKK